jgi:hypothetical protein
VSFVIIHDENYTSYNSGVSSNRGCRIINYNYVDDNMLRYHVNNVHNVRDEMFIR